MAKDKLPSLDDLRHSVSECLAVLQSKLGFLAMTINADSSLNDGQKRKQIEELLKEVDILRDAYDELAGRNLDTMKPRYEVLAKNVVVESNALKRTVGKFKDVVAVISALGAVINIIGRLVLVAGI